MARGPLYSKRHSEQHTAMGRPCVVGSPGLPLAVSLGLLGLLGLAAGQTTVNDAIRKTQGQQQKTVSTYSTGKDPTVQSMVQSLRTQGMQRSSSGGTGLATSLFAVSRTAAAATPNTAANANAPQAADTAAFDDTTNAPNTNVPQDYRRTGAYSVPLSEIQRSAGSRSSPGGHGVDNERSAVGAGGAGSGVNRGDPRAYDSAGSSASRTRTNPYRPADATRGASSSGSRADPYGYGGSGTEPSQRYPAYSSPSPYYGSSTSSSSTGSTRPNATGGSYPYQPRPLYSSGRTPTYSSSTSDPSGYSSYQPHYSYSSQSSYGYPAGYAGTDYYAESGQSDYYSTEQEEEQEDEVGSIWEVISRGIRRAKQGSA